MNEWRKVLVNQDASILETLSIIDAGAIQITLVVDNNERLLGTVTDGDIRRGILRGVLLSSPVSEIMNRNPLTARIDESQDSIVARMRNRHLKHIPIVDHLGKVVRIERLEEILQKQQRDNWVVLMAGGLGSRLSPLTDECPKPLLKVGSKPILETIIENFIEYGFHRFYISVNYRAEMIQSYFGNGERLGIEIRYIHETQRLGTAGALSLIQEIPDSPMIIMNGDLLTKVNFKHILDFHIENRADATMCVREYEFQIPYGVVKVDNHRLLKIEEKPTQRYFVNGGIYVINPEVLPMVPRETFFDMPSLFDMLLQRAGSTSVFPIREYWVDIGRMEDYNRANLEFGGEFFK